MLDVALSHWSAHSRLAVPMVYVQSLHKENGRLRMECSPRPPFRTDVTFSKHEEAFCSSCTTIDGALIGICGTIPLRNCSVQHAELAHEHNEKFVLNCHA